MWVNIQDWKRPIHGESYTLRDSDESKPFTAICQVSACGGELWLVRSYSGAEVKMVDSLQVSLGVNNA